MAQGKFIVFCGGEGNGKSTQAKLLAEFLKKEGKEALLTKEPGGDPVGNDIRSILLNPEYKEIFSYRAELLLFIANRAQHVERVVKPALEAGKIVVCDRFDSDTFAYQFGGRKAGIVHAAVSTDIFVGTEFKNNKNIANFSYIFVLSLTRG